MQENVKNAMLGVLYALFLFVILYGVLHPIAYAVEAAIAGPSIQNPDQAGPPIMIVSGFYSSVISIVVALLLTIIILMWATIGRITTFLLPNKFKVIGTLIFFIVVFGLGVLDFLPIMKYIMLKPLTFFGPEIFGQLVIPLVVYYVLFSFLFWIIKQFPFLDYKENKNK